MRNSRPFPFPVMADMTVKMVRDYLRRKKSIIIPIGVIEQHGYHLPLKTDALQAEHLSRMIGAKTGILVAPVMYQSFSGGECPGTINISPTTMSLVISDMLVSLASRVLGKKIVTDIVSSASRKINEVEKKADGIYREVAFKPEPLMLET